MKKKIFCFALVLIMAAALIPSLSACKGYDLYYSNWNLDSANEDNIEMQMIRAFEKEHKVKIGIKAMPSGGAYKMGIDAMATRNSLADVLMVPDLMHILEKGYALDLTDMVKDDADWAKIPKSLEEPTHFGEDNDGDGIGDTIFAIPFAMHLMGYYANTSAFGAKNVTTLKHMWDNDATNDTYTIDQLVEAMKLMSASHTTASPMVGVNVEASVFEWYPAIKHHLNYSQEANYKPWGYYAYEKGTGFRINTDEFKEGLTLTQNIRKDQLSFNALPSAQKEAFYESQSGNFSDVWDNGQIALRWGFTYEANDMLSKNLTGDHYKFLGLPEGFVGFVSDFAIVSKDTKNPELALKFAKWMSYSPEGMKKRLDIDEAIVKAGNAQEFQSLPITTDATFVQDYFTRYERLDGVQEAFELMNSGDKALGEGVKYVPAYVTCRFELLTGVPVTTAEGASIANSNIGQFLDAVLLQDSISMFTSYANSLEIEINKNYQRAVEKLSRKGA